MKPHPLAVILVFRNQKDEVEGILSSIYSGLHSGFSLYVVDDASDDDTPRVIESVIGHYQHEDTHFYENPMELGRDRSIRELFQLIDSPFIWIPDPENLDFSQFSALPRLVKSKEKEQSAESSIVKGEVLREGSIASGWISAFDETGQVAEPSQDVVGGGGDGGQNDSPVRKEKPVFGLRSQRRAATLELPEAPSDACRAIFDELNQLVGEGEYLAAMKRIDATLLSHSNDIGIIKLKIRVLELMRRYVEAAELKHQLKLGGPGVARPKVRRESIIIVDPADDIDGAIPDDDSARQPHSLPSTGETPKRKTKFIKNFIIGDDEELPSMDDLLAKAEFEYRDDEPTAAADPAQLDKELSIGSEPEQSEALDQHIEEPSVAAEPEQQVEDELLNTELTPDDSGDKIDEHEVTGEEVVPGESTIQRPESYDKKPRISIIIPTAIDGRGLLERTMLSLSRFADKSDRELIIIDNASLDDTFEYLRQLKEQNFIQVRIISNEINHGFAKAVNQGIETARGTYVLVMHNDVEIESDLPGQMADLMDQHQELTILGPVAEVSLNEPQRRRVVDPDSTAIRNVKYVDSFCMMFRRDNAARFDEQYGLAYYEDIDFCMEAAQKGGQIAVATGLKVNHLGGATTSAIGRENYSRNYWKNTSIFESKWNLLPQLPEFSEDTSDLDKVIAISEVINPYFPEQHLMDELKHLMTSELRNQIVSSSHDTSCHIALMRLMMILDARDILRTLEDRLPAEHLDQMLLYQLIDYYYHKNIYSRCLKYLDQMEPDRKQFGFKLLELRVYIGSRDFARATTLLAELIREVPTHPELFKFTADIHKMSGNHKEAEEFYAYAAQTDPVLYGRFRQ